MESQRKVGKACQYKDMKKGECIFLDTFSFVKRENERQLDELAGKIEDMEEEAESPEIEFEDEEVSESVVTAPNTPHTRGK
jgi:hypothetical protein